MKKLLKKRYFVPLLVVVVMAIAATAAYAWWTTTVTSDPNNITTGGAALVVGGDTPINAANLIPQDTLSNNASDAVPSSYKTTYFYVHNTGDTPLDFVGWLDDGTGDYGVLGSQVWVKITIAPAMPPSPWDPTGSLSSVGGPYLVYRGPIGQLYGKTAGSAYLTTLNPHTPLAAGQYAFYQVATWLDGPTCNNDSMHKSMSCTLKFESVP